MPNNLICAAEFRGKARLCLAPGQGKILKYYSSINISELVDFLETTYRETARSIVVVRRIHIGIIEEVQTVRVVVSKSN